MLGQNDINLIISQNTASIVNKFRDVCELFDGIFENVVAD